MAGQILIQRGAGTTGGGGGGSPGGANTQVQFNDGGAFGGDAGLVFDKTTDLLTADHVLLAQGTITDPQPNLDGTVTWNDAADTFTAWLLNVTNTNSNAASKLLDLQVGGSSAFNVTRVGQAVIGAPGGAGANAKLQNLGGFGNLRILLDGTTVSIHDSAGTQKVSLSMTGTGTINLGTGEDVVITRDEANVLAQRNGTNAQTLRVYQTFTDPSNYVRASLSCSAGSVVLAGEGAGTGGVPEIRLVPSNTVTVSSAAGVPLGLLAGRIFASDGTNTPIRISGHENDVALGSTTPLSWGTSNAYNSTRDLRLTRDEPGVLVISDPNAAGAAIQSTERSTPGTPPANGWVLYGEDNGSGKTRLMVLFNTGAAQQVAIQP